MPTTRTTLFALSACLALTLSACGNTRGERTTTGALIGGAGGAVAGNAIGGTGGAIVGGVAGGVAGAAIGSNSQ